jgi:hypothetical protein
MSEVLVIFVALTNDLQFIVKPLDAFSCPSYEQARGWFINTYPIEEIKHWTFKCFEQHTSI